MPGFFDYFYPLSDYFDERKFESYYLQIRTETNDIYRPAGIGSATSASSLLMKKDCTEINEILFAHRGELTSRKKDADKGYYGRVIIAGGSCGMAGAAYLSGISAFRCGVGMVRFLGPGCNRVILQTLLPEAMYESSDDMSDQTASLALSWGNILILGPGLSRSDEARTMVKRFTDPGFLDTLLPSGKSAPAKLRFIIIDADALNIISEEGIDLKEASSCRLSPHIVITPHVGEMSRLTSLPINEIKSDPAGIALEYSRSHGVDVVLKDHVTFCASPERVVRIDSGTGAMAKAGSGDVLTGFIAGVAAILREHPEDAAPVGAFLHGRAGTIAERKKGCHGLLARDIADHAFEAFASI